ncbi:hypothetical protein GLOIN_2v1668068 [Rhizophagus irregularis DAOM 181602=DAOM 197198]|uniref:Uncharacterized protein n=1 Tax=Rhizophagus irregularis (strain DAOM 181602 / DAOM 197198 / MUCL 43194) TaxID=747089 RepID=A0A2P4PIW6_RHIID|nr:hypothetical protein GLOIN_2v1668068 [Rhizophagus irregularis DAOM 181602=DAOM 197198]POG65335.1 hypothetical protein GLOIN_2v1668068 [Rhizophagus irregularis DAOM 181602=DAOM 197198]|eukprot:XP_025172201.1 hypothetical protein GLOIN_2v1668068 [Rhizophagus irregularis DAOM 181602=DAOM 197198]
MLVLSISYFISVCIFNFNCIYCSFMIILNVFIFFLKSFMIQYIDIILEIKCFF